MTTVRGCEPQHAAVQQCLSPASRVTPLAMADDPRFRPWYVLAATTKPKDIVLVIDSSGSMGLNNRMSKAKAAAQVVLDTLNPNDWVAVVDFDTSTQVLSSPACFASGLSEATPRNRASLSAFVDNQVSLGGQTEYVRALKAAYKLLNDGKSNGRTSDGDRAILFLTDGEPSDSTPSDILDYIQSQHDADPTVKLLTYGFGDSLSDSAKKRLADMASITGGITDVVPDSGDLRTALGSYYDFFSSPDPNQGPVFTAPYFDAFGLGLVVTAAMPVFEGSTLKGVAGIDLTLTDLVSQVTFFNAGQYSFSFVVDVKGRVLTHPLLPAPDEGSADAIIVDISRLEPDADFSTHVRTPMLAGETGTYSLSLNRALSRGDARTEGVETKQLPFTIWSVHALSPRLYLPE